ncbi:MAG: hypothetical protein A2020_05980 [Lentisphaerae bacterium GWF2_45_14]|nr:MAG: hypothetical protein A2020_05980 [Lentisphaerae bacterium GWF2_45_14]
MSRAKDKSPLMESSAVCGFPSPAEQYVESPLDLNELLVHKPAATFFVRAAGAVSMRLPTATRHGKNPAGRRSLKMT